MNNLAITFLAIAVQVTVVALLAMVCHPLLARRGPGAAASTLAASVGLILLLTGIAFCPLPSWWTWTPAPSAPRAPELEATSTVPAEPSNSVHEEEHLNGIGEAAPQTEATGLALSPSLLHRLWRGIGAQNESASTSKSWWPIAVVAVFVVGTLPGLARLFLGLWAIHGYRRRSRRIEDPALHGLVESLRIELGCTRPVELRESPDLATAATVGWVRPILFLPSDWRMWNDDERRAVLAHELAHVRRWDYVSGLLACLSVALHFYHPLVYWLAARLRLQQELAADALGARFAGGRDLYLHVLAQMALRQSGRPVGWPARAFLPAPGTLLRRVQMLRVRDGFPERSLSRPTKLLLTATLLCTAIGVSAVRSPAQKSDDDKPSGTEKGDQSTLKNADGFKVETVPGTQTVRYSVSAVDSGAADEPALDLSYLPPDAMGAWGIRPAALFRRPEMKQYTAKLNKLVALGSKTYLKLPEDMVLPIEDFEQITGFVTIQTDKNKQERQTAMLTSVSMIRSVKDFDWAKQFKVIFPKSEEVKYEGKVYYKVPRGEVAAMLGGVFGSELYYYVPDSRTVVINPEENLRQLIHAGKPARPKFPWAEDWKRVENGLAAYALSNRDLTWLKDRTPTEDDIAGMTALLENSESLVVGIDYQDAFALQAVARAANEDAAGKSAEAFKGLLDYAVKTLNKDVDKNPPQGRERSIYEFEIEILNKSTVTRKGREIRWHSEPTGALSELLPLLVPEDLLK